MTVNERFLLHLLKYVSLKNDWEVPEFLTQVGIAEAIGIKRSEIPRAVNALKKNGLVFEEIKHITGITRRRKAYFLTSKGVIRAGELREMLEKSAAPVDRAIKAESKKVGLHIRHFFGRKDELSLLQRAMSSRDTSMALIYGIAGIGKTALATRFIQKRDLTPFWHGCRQFDTLRYIVSRIFEHTGHDPGSIDELMGDRRRLFDEVIAAMKAFGGLYVFDDAYRAPHEVHDLFIALLEGTVGSRSLLTILTARDRMNFYDVRDVKIRHRLVEIDLSGLDDESARLVYQRAKGTLDGFEVLNAAVMGHPLALELAAPQGVGTPPMATSDIYNFMNEEIGRRLDGASADFAAFLSLFRGSVSSEAFTLFEDFNWSMVDTLSLSGLLLRDPLLEDHYRVHDVLLDFFSRRLFRDRRKDYHRAIAKYYLAQLDNEAVLEGLYHLMMSEDYTAFEEEFFRYREGLSMSGMQMELYSLVEEASREVKESKVRAKMLWIREELYHKMGAPDDLFEYIYQCKLMNTYYLKVPIRVERAVGHILPDSEMWGRLEEERVASLEKLKDVGARNDVISGIAELAWVRWLKGDIPYSLNTIDECLKVYNAPPSIALLGVKVALEAGDIERAQTYLGSIREHRDIFGDEGIDNPALDSILEDLGGCMAFLDGDPVSALAHFEDARKIASENAHWRLIPYYSLHMLQASRAIEGEVVRGFEEVASGFSRFEDDKGLFYLGMLRCMEAEDDTREMLVAATRETLAASGLNSTTLTTMLERIK